MKSLKGFLRRFKSSKTKGRKGKRKSYIIKCKNVNHSKTKKHRYFMKGG